MIIKNQWIFPLILICSLILFAPSFNYYFFQDDWFVLNWVRTQNFWSFFDLRTDIIYWRPLTMPVFFALGNFLFGLNPLGYHFVVFIFHLINSILIYELFKNLKISDNFSKFAAFIYATSAFHFIGLSWISTASYIIGPTFILSTILFFLKRKLKTSLAFFLLSLASSEFSLVIIPLLLLLVPKTKKTIIKLLPFLAFTAFYLVLRFIIFPIPANGQYEIGLSLKIITNVFWYFAWTFNVAEKFSSIFFISNSHAYPGLFFSFAKYLALPTILIAAFLVALVFSKVKISKLIFSTLWFLIGILPVIFVPLHIYPIYLAIASIGPIFAFTLALEKFSQKNYLLPILIGTIWFLSSLATLAFTRQNHWIANEQAISNSYINFTQKINPNPGKNSVFVFRPATLDFAKRNNFTLVETEDNVKQALNNQDAIKVVFGGKALRSIYLNWQQNINVDPSSQLTEIAPR